LCLFVVIEVVLAAGVRQWWRKKGSCDGMQPPHPALAVRMWFWNTRSVKSAYSMEHSKRPALVLMHGVRTPLALGGGIS
jgi:hypothetical protein